MTNSSQQNVRSEAAAEDLFRVDAYREWQKAEGVRVIEDFAFEDLNQVELGPWLRKGGRGAIINIPNEDLPFDAHLVELKPRGSSEPEHHIYEQMVFVVSGRGSTSVWIDETRKHFFEWNRGSVFSLPLNAWYQHFNGSGVEPARYIAVTDAPVMMRQFCNLDFILNNPFMFEDRFGSPEQYGGMGKLYRHNQWVTNFVPNAATARVFDRRERGGGSKNVHLEMAHNKMTGFISEFEVGTYKNGHRHGPGAHLFILNGTGYTLLWQEGTPYRRCNWKPGSLVIVPFNECFHQHFNTGPTPARYMAFIRGWRRFGNLSLLSKNGPAAMDIKEGGWQVTYEDEDPQIHELFEKELARNGATCRMKGLAPHCTGEVGPTRTTSMRT